MRMHDNNSSAVHEARLPLSTRLYETYYGTRPRPFIYDNLWFIVRYLPAISRAAKQYIMVKEILQFGAVNPCMVVDVKKSLVAVFTTLTAAGDVPTPVLKIKSEKLELLSDSSTIENGLRLASVANYTRTEESWKNKQWSDFHPIVADCLCANEYACQTLLKQIKPEAWQCLDLSLDQVPKPFQEGLYSVKINKQLAWDAY